MLNTSVPEHSSLTGMMLAAVAFALFTSVDTIFKLMATGHPASQLLLVNGCFALLPVLGWTMLTGGLGRLRSLRFGQHLARGSANVLSGFAAIYAYSRLPLTDFYAIVFAGPLIITALSAFWLGEKVEGMRWLAIIAGFVGILIVANPFESGGAHDAMAATGRFAALISVFCYALSVVMIRRMRFGESSMTFAFYSYVVSIVIGGVLVLEHGAPALNMEDFLHLALSGTLAGVANICLMTAYHRTPVALVAPFQYTQIIWGAVAGYFIWAHVPDVRLVMGAIIVGASGLFVIYREVRTKDNNL